MFWIIVLILIIQVCRIRLCTGLYLIFETYKEIVKILKFSFSDLRFYHIHGRNARVSNNGLTASRPRTLGEFNHAIVITNRPLREGEMFEVKIETLVDRWSGSIEAGVTAIRPEEFEFPSTMTDMDHGTWMLSGSSVMKDGFTLRSGYPCDLDTLTVGTRIGSF